MRYVHSEPSPQSSCCKPANQHPICKDYPVVLVCRLSERPELRPTAEVVSILEPSARRNAVVGVLREEPSGNLMFLMPADPRMPKCVVRSAALPANIKQALKVWTR